MRIAFYAPMNSPGVSMPSGDVRMARSLMRALATAGYAVEPASRFRSYDGSGDADRQRRLGELGQRLARRLIERYRHRPQAERPVLWFTYHLYHKAPDWLGPTVSRTLGVPYVVAEASHAPKQNGGPWDIGYRAAEEAISAADLVVGVNPDDRERVLPLLDNPGRLLTLKPFIDTAPYAAAMGERVRHRARLERAWGFDRGEPILLTVAMMRPGAKLASYRALGRVLGRLESRPWRLLVAGDGAERASVEDALSVVGNRVIFLGNVDEANLVTVYGAADICVWPAIREAFGMALLEAQAAGLPVVAGRVRGVPSVVEDGETGTLVPADDDEAMAAAVAGLLDDAGLRRAMGRRAAARMRRDHDLTAAAGILGAALERLVQPRVCPS